MDGQTNGKERIANIHVRTHEQRGNDNNETNT
jgi:hypothetical protein